jgi:hypothetical protein
MHKMSNPFDELSQALDAESWDWLSENAPDVARGVAVAVQRRQQPADIRRFVAGRTGRNELAMRCFQAASHLARQGEA